MNENNIEITLFNPEIPQNTGNIVRTCRATDTSLNLIKPLGFHFTDRKLKRAGLDYWEDVEINIHSVDEFENAMDNPEKPIYIFTSKTDKCFWDVDYSKGATLVFGNESKGLPEEYYEKYRDRLVTIPISKNARCLNLSNAVSIALYEALRCQRNVTDLQLSSL